MDRDLEGYTTAEFRKSIAEAFEAARFSDKIVEVSHHGKPWVSIISPENAEYVRKIRQIGKIEAREVKAVVDNLDSPIEFGELFLRIEEARKRR
ncbi:MAG: hypothetical protein AAF543_09620 [Pseudomonadota bacterium]